MNAIQVTRKSRGGGGVLLPAMRRPPHPGGGGRAGWSGGQSTWVPMCRCTSVPRRLGGGGGEEEGGGAEWHEGHTGDGEK